MDELLYIWVTEAQPMEDRRLWLKFNDGCIKVFDCKPMIEKYPIFEPLKDDNVFRDITLDGWTVTWAKGTLDIAPEHLYLNGVRPYDIDEDAPLHTAAEESADYGK